MLKALRRRGWVVLLATGITALVALAVASLRTPTYSAKGVAVVAANRGLTPDQAIGLAVTDAVLIPQDAAIARSVARAVHTTTKDIQSRLSASNDPTTAILRIDYQGTSASNAQAGATAALRSIAGPQPVSPNIASNSIQIVRLPTPPSASRGVPTLVAIGIILGLALGSLLLVAWERADPRIDDIDDLGAAAASPATSFDSMSDATSAALLERWRELAGQAPRSVALVPATEGLEASLGDIACVLELTDENTTAVLPVESQSSLPTHGETFLFVGGVPGGRHAGEGVALACDLTVLVVERGTSRMDLRRVLEVLRRFGIHPAWSILVSRDSLIHARVRVEAESGRAENESIGSQLRQTM
jgi:capsular polysaccharide biosynthesis protein